MNQSDRASWIQLYTAALQGLASRSAIASCEEIAAKMADKAFAEYRKRFTEDVEALEPPKDVEEVSVLVLKDGIPQGFVLGTRRKLRNRTELWDAINQYTRACGGDSSSKTVSSTRMDAVVTVEKAVDAEIHRATAFLDEALNSGDGTYKP